MMQTGQASVGGEGSCLLPRTLHHEGAIKGKPHSQSARAVPAPAGPSLSRTVSQVGADALWGYGR